MSEKRSYQDVQEYVRRVADKLGWKLNNDQVMLNHLITGLMENFNRLGYYNCPCRDSQADRGKDKDITCPCLYAREADVRERGYCYCALFFRKDYDMTRGVTMIPDRRPLEKYR
jgi:ferredoxin-thioredoxin reductase catalytic subunit